MSLERRSSLACVFKCKLMGAILRQDCFDSCWRGASEEFRQRHKSRVLCKAENITEEYAISDSGADIMQ